MRLYLLYEANFTGITQLRIDIGAERGLNDASLTLYRQKRAKSLGEGNIFLYENIVETELTPKEFLGELERKIEETTGRKPSFTDKTKIKAGLGWKKSEGIGYCLCHQEFHEKAFQAYKEHVASANKQKRQ